jgi:hypothetical protein
MHMEAQIKQNANSILFVSHSFKSNIINLVFITKPKKN